MSEEGSNIIKYNQGENSIKISFIIYADMGIYLKKCMETIIIQKSHQHQN